MNTDESHPLYTQCTTAHFLVILYTMYKIRNLQGNFTCKTDLLEISYEQSK